MRRLGPAVAEVRGIVDVLREENDPRAVGPVLVTGMLAEQLAKQLGAGAAPGAVVVDASRLAHCSALIHVIAGDPGVADDELVQRADRDGVPVILVQLWPQATWTAPYVFTPFVVECRAGEGFPIEEIAARLVEAVPEAVELGRRVPVLEQKASEAVVGTSMIRSALLASIGKGKRAARPLITLEQIRMLTELRQLDEKPSASSTDALKAVAPIAAAVLGAGFLFRSGATAAKRVLPASVVDASVAAAGTWLVGEAARRLTSRAT